MQYIAGDGEKVLGRASQVLGESGETEGKVKTTSRSPCLGF